MSISSEQEISVDYSVKVQIWEGRSIKASDVRPYVKVFLFDTKKTTPVKRSAESPYWNEVFFFNAQKIHSAVLSEAIKFQLLGSKNVFSKDVLLGSFILSLRDVYHYEHHCMQKKWLLLTNDYHEFVGYLKVTVAVVGPNESFPPEEITDDFEVDVAANVIRPKTITLYPVQLFVKFFEICQVPDFTDLTEKNFPDCNLKDFKPLLEVSFDGEKAFFKNLQRWKNQRVNEGAMIVVKNYPAIAKKIYVSLFDSKNASKSKNSIATAAIDLNAFKKDKRSIDLSSPIETSFGPHLLNLYTNSKTDSVSEPYIFLGRIAVEIILTVSSELQEQKEGFEAFPIPPLTKPIAHGALFRCIFVVQEINLINELVSEDAIKINASWVNSSVSTLPLYLKSDPKKGYRFADLSRSWPVLILETALESDLEALVVSNTLKNFGDKAIESLLNLKTNIISYKMTASQVEFARNVALPGLVQILNGLVLRLHRTKNQLERMSFADSTYLLEKLGQILATTTQILKDVPKPDCQEILANVENLLHDLKTIRIPVLTTLPPLIVSFYCKATSGSIFAYLKIPIQNVMHNVLCPGMQYNVSTTAKMKYASKNVFESSQNRIAAQLTYQCWAFKQGDACPANEINKGFSLQAFAVMHEYEEKSLLNWQPGEPRFHDEEGNLYQSIGNLQKLKDSPYSFREQLAWSQFTNKLNPTSSVDSSVENEAYSSNETCRAFIYEYEVKKDSNIEWVPNNPRFLGSDLVQVPDSEYDFYPPQGWQWTGGWLLNPRDVSSGIGCDENGWQYSCFVGKVEKCEINDWVPEMNIRHRLRRRKIFRELAKENLDKDTILKVKQKEEVFYEYSNNYWNDYFTYWNGEEIFRRKLWMRKLVGEPNLAKCQRRVTLLDENSGTEIKSQVFYFLDPSKAKQSMHLHAYLYQGEDLGTANTQCNSFVRIHVQSKRCETHTVEKSVSPLFDEMVILKEINCYQVQSQSVKHRYQPLLMLPSVFIEVSAVSRGQESLIGYFNTSPLVLQKSADKRGHLKWFHLAVGQNNRGRILCSFELIDPSLNAAKAVPILDSSLRYFSVPYPIAPATRPMTIEILFWGLRGNDKLKGTGDSLRKLGGQETSNLVVECTVLKTSKHSSVLKNIHEHPNFPRDVQKLEMFLPVKKEYSPVIDIALRRFEGKYRKGSGHVVAVATITGLTDLLKENLNECAENFDQENEISFDGRPENFNELDIDFQPSSRDSLAISKSRFTGNRVQFYKRQETKNEDLLSAIEKGDFWTLFYAARKHCSVSSEDFRKNLSSESSISITFYQSNLEDFYGNFTDFLSSYPLSKASRSQRALDHAKNHICDLKVAIAAYPKLNNGFNFGYFVRAPSTVPKKLLVRLYVLQADNLPAMDFNTGRSDPYVHVKTSGGQVFSKREEFKANNLEPVFGLSWEFKATLPADYLLRVEIKNHNLVRDELMGYTEIDLENRWSSRFRGMCPLPGNYDSRTWRDNHHPSDILSGWCKRHLFADPHWMSNHEVQIGDKIYELSDYKTEASAESSDAVRETLALRILQSWNLVREHIERRKLINPNMGNRDVGNLYMWMELYDSELGAPRMPMIDVSPREPEHMVLRIVVSSAQETVLEERSFSGDLLADVYVQSWLEGMEHNRQRTDVHYRCMDGTALFNWRFVFDFNLVSQEQKIEVKEKKGILSRHMTTQHVPPIIHFQVWDNDFVHSDDFIGEISLNMANMPRPAQFVHECQFSMMSNTKARPWISLFQTKCVRGFFPMTRFTKLGDYKELTSKLEVEMELLTEEEAAEKPAAKARDSPNAHPYLAPPERPKTSFHFWLNPWRSCKFVLWRRVKWKIVTILIVALIALFLFLFIYTFPTTVPQILVKSF